MKKKILFLVPSLYFGGGAGKVVSSLTMKISNEFDISIMTLFHFDKIYPFKGKYYSLKENLHFGRIFLRLFKMYRIINDISPNIMISFINHTSFWTIIIKYLFNINIPLIIAVDSNPTRQSKKRFYYKYLVRFLYPLKKVNGIVPVSNELRKILYKDFRINRRKINTIYNGIDIEKIKMMAREELDDYEDVFYNQNIVKFITIGRLSKEKGHKYLIEAFSHVIKEVPNSKLFIIGEGPLRSQLLELIKFTRLEDNVILLGLRENPFKYISKANIFVFSSLHEGLPYVLIEAMACDLPIISTNCKTGPKEILGNGKYGILVKVADVKDLSNKMIFLTKNEKIMKDFSKKSSQRVKLFEYNKFVNNWINLLERYLN